MAARPPDFDALLSMYARFRTGYPREVYERILAALGRREGLRVLDVASGTGLGAEGLRAHAARLVACDAAPGMLRASWVRDRAQARAEALPFRPGAFDLVTCAQAFHWFAGSSALAEMHRVLRPRGLAAVWWKYEAAEDPVSQLADRVVLEVTGQPDPHTLFVRGGAVPGIAASAFRAQEAWIEHAVRYTAASYVGYQASREILRHSAGPRREQVLDRLGRELRSLHGERPFDVAYRTRLLLLKGR